MDSRPPNLLVLLVLLIACPIILFFTYYPLSDLHEAQLELLLCTILLLGRYHGRWKAKTGWRYDDLFALPALGFALMVLRCMGIVVQKGTAKEMFNNFRMALDDADIEKFTEGTKAFYTGIYFFFGALWCLKFCVLCVFSRVVIDEQEWKYAFRLNKVATLGFLLLNFLVMAFHCQPYKRNWQVRPDPEGECDVGYGPNVVIVVGDGSTNILSIMMTIPFLFRRANIARRTPLCLAVGLGVLVVAAAIARCTVASTAGMVAHPAHTTLWQIREITLFTLLTHAPFITPLLWMSEGRLRSWSGGSFNLSGSRNNRASSFGALRRSDDIERGPGSGRRGSMPASASMPLYDLSGPSSANKHYDDADDGFVGAKVGRRRAASQGHSLGSDSISSSLPTPKDFAIEDDEEERERDERYRAMLGRGDTSVPVFDSCNSSRRGTVGSARSR